MKIDSGSTRTCRAWRRRPKPTRRSSRASWSVPGGTRWNRPSSDTHAQIDRRRERERDHRVRRGTPTACRAEPLVARSRSGSTRAGGTAAINQPNVVVFIRGCWGWGARTSSAEFVQFVDIDRAVGAGTAPRSGRGRPSLRRRRPPSRSGRRSDRRRCPTSVRTRPAPGWPALSISSRQSRITIGLGRISTPTAIRSQKIRTETDEVPADVHGCQPPSGGVSNWSDRESGRLDAGSGPGSTSSLRAGSSLDVSRLEPARRPAPSAIVPVNAEPQPRPEIARRTRRRPGPGAGGPARRHRSAATSSSSDASSNGSRNWSSGTARPICQPACRTAVENLRAAWLLIPARAVPKHRDAELDRRSPRPNSGARMLQRAARAGAAARRLSPM